MLEKKPLETQERTSEVLSFRSTIVMTKRPGSGQPTLRDVEAALTKAGIKFVMPAAAEGTIVISVSDA